MPDRTVTVYKTQSGAKYEVDYNNKQWRHINSPNRFASDGLREGGDWYPLEEIKRIDRDEHIGFSMNQVLAVRVEAPIIGKAIFVHGGGYWRLSTDIIHIDHNVFMMEEAEHGDEEED